MTFGHCEQYIIDSVKSSMGRISLVHKGILINPITIYILYFFIDRYRQIQDQKVTLCTCVRLHFPSFKNQKPFLSESTSVSENEHYHIKRCSKPVKWEYAKKFTSLHFSRSTRPEILSDGILNKSLIGSNFLESYGSIISSL